jgi:hypothetical protein
LVLGPVAQADIVDYTFNTPNTALSAFPGPYGTLEVNLTGPSTAEFTFAVKPGFWLVDGSSADLSINATSFTYQSFSCVAGLPAGCSFASTGSGTVASFGNFNFTLNMFDGTGNPSTSITFDITNDLGTWASAADVLKINNLGNLAAAHFAVVGSSCDGGLCTGFAANTAAVPGPIVGAGLPGVLAGFGAAVAWYRKRRAAL